MKERMTSSSQVWVYDVYTYIIYNSEEERGRRREDNMS